MLLATQVLQSAVSVLVQLLIYQLYEKYTLKGILICVYQTT